ncbi:MAG: ATP-binding cassette domain-containing protein [Bacteroidota bacterium]
MQLFAIVANSGRLTERGRTIVETFLRQQLSQSHVPVYLSIFDEYVKFLQGKSDAGKERKRVSVNSVKVLRICTDINSELELRQKYIVLIRLIEFVYSDEDVTEQEMEFLSTVSNVFNISDEDHKHCMELVHHNATSELTDSADFLLVSNQPSVIPAHRFLLNDSIHGQLVVLFCKSAGILFARYHGDEQLTVNGQPFISGSILVFSPGSVIRDSRMRPVYYSDVMRMFLEDDKHTPVVLTAKHIEYIFPNGKKGLNNICFSAASGSLVGIMGGSGAGKSTLLNILNSNLIPSSGEVLINDVSIHANTKRTGGLIGYVPQDDLLMEDLTVFQNLFLNSKLCFGELTDVEITNKVDALLESLGLTEIRNIKVGDVFNKTISGGQRKRLNIGLELIRRPPVLFVDEPTSGLSSMDSENVMDLLKQLSLNGNLVFVVIHQPSSDIYKLFDQLLLLDIGGYNIYYGNPSDALIYFKEKASYADNESECVTCGNINPEQIFSIIEAKVLDEFGNITHTRKVSPVEWAEAFRSGNPVKDHDDGKEKPLPASTFVKPSRFKQMLVFIKRDVLSKLNNTQYLLINFLQAPVLSFIIAFFLRYFNEGGDYIFRNNTNLPAYIFMSVIVAIFMGLTVSAEEIIHDRKIQKREAFLHLSRSSYLLSKIIILFAISAIQTFSFVVVGNLVFGVQDMLWDYFLILFAVSCFANLLGLNISAAFDSVVTIYILIPFLVIPQIILSGVIVKYEKLNPDVTTQDKVPVIGEMMAARWAFEALAVNQFINNRYEELFFDEDKTLGNATYKKDMWLSEMGDKLELLKKGKGSVADYVFLKNEITEERNTNKQVSFDGNEVLNGSYSESKYAVIKDYFKKLNAFYIKQYNTASASKDKYTDNLIARIGEKNVSLLKDNYTNEYLSDVVLNHNSTDLFVHYKDRLVRRFQPVYMSGPQNSLRAPYYVNSKSLFGNYCSTYSVNLLVIFMMTGFLAVTLYYNLLRKFFKMFSK